LDKTSTFHLHFDKQNITFATLKQKKMKFIIIALIILFIGVTLFFMKSNK